MHLKSDYCTAVSASGFDLHRFLGLTSGILAGLLSFLAFNFFFISPISLFRFINHRFNHFDRFPDRSRGIEPVCGAGERGCQVGKKARVEATRMYELISALAGLTDIQSIMQTLAEKNYQYLSV